VTVARPKNKSKPAQARSKSVSKKRVQRQAPAAGKLAASVRPDLKVRATVLCPPRLGHGLGSGPTQKSTVFTCSAALQCMQHSVDFIVHLTTAIYVCTPCVQNRFF